MSSGKVFVFSGPSGAGKTTLADKVLSEFDFFQKIVTYTTRPSREGEKNGVDYNFVSKEKFEEFIKNNEMLEYATVYGNYYGSRKSEVEKVISSGKSVLFVVDVQGAITIKKKFSSAITIFIKAPSIEIMKERLIRRGKDSMEVIDRRVDSAKKEMPLEKEFMHTIINDNLDIAVSEAKKLILNSLKD